MREMQRARGARDASDASGERAREKGAEGLQEAGGVGPSSGIA